jgi:hypothetical protein
MRVDSASLSEVQLLAAVGTRGVRVSVWQLKRWRSAGLIVPPKRVHVRGRRGSASYYPPEAVDQVVAVARGLEHERVLAHLLIDRWWDGHWVDRNLLRTALADVPAGLASEISRLRDETGDPVAAAEMLVDQIRQSHHADPFYRLLRNRLGPDWDHMLAAISTLMHLAFGHDPPWENTGGGPGDEPSPTQLLERALGVERAQTDTLPGGDRLLPTSINTAAEMTTLASTRAFDLEHTAATLRASTDEDLELARTDARMYEQLGVIAAAAEIMFGPDTAGLATIRELCAGGARWRAQLVSMALLLRRLVPAGRFEELKPAIAGAAVDAQVVIDAREQ